MHPSGQIPNLTLLCPPPPSTGSQEVTQTGILGIPEDGARGWEGAQFSGDEQEASLQASEDGEGQGSLACGGPCGLKELDTTERLKNNKT